MKIFGGIGIFLTTAQSLPIDSRSPSSDQPVLQDVPIDPEQMLEFLELTTDSLAEYRDQRVEEALDLGNYKGASMFQGMNVNDWANWFTGLWEATTKAIAGQTAESIDAMSDEEFDKLIQESGFQEFYYLNDYYSDEFLISDSKEAI